MQTGGLCEPAGWPEEWGGPTGQLSWLTNPIPLGKVVLTFSQRALEAGKVCQWYGKSTDQIPNKVSWAH